MAPFGRNKNPNVKFEQMLHQARQARLPFDKDCWMNIAFWAGEQYVEWGNEIMALRRIPPPGTQPKIRRPVANKIKHFVLDEQSNVLQTKPTVDVLPASDDPADISTASVLLAYLNWLADDAVEAFNEKLSTATLWALAGTEAFLKWTWDEQKHRGKIGVASPLDVYPDPWARHFSVARYAFHSQFMDVEQVYDLFGIEVQAQSLEKADPIRTMVSREMGMAPILQGAQVNELWMPPNRRHPQGLFVVWAGHTQLIAPCPYPYAHGQLPFTQIGSIPRLGTTHYTSIVSDLRIPQMELNKFHAQMIEVREAFANPKWWVPTDLDMESLPDDSPRQVLRGDSHGGTLEPKLIMPTMMPPNDAGAWIDNEMMDVAGLHEVSQAQAPGRVDSAKGLELLKESDNRQAELLRTIQKAITVGYWQEAQLLKQFGSPQQVFQTYSREGFPETHQLMTEKISPGMRVRILMGTGLSTSRASREDKLMTMWGQGIITDPKIMAELLELPISSVSPDDQFDMRLARNENLFMASGKPLTPNSWDNHDIHRREHDNYRKTADYKLLGKKAQQIFEMHCELHDQLEIQQLGKQLQIQSMAAAVAQGEGFQNPQQPGPLNGQTAGPLTTSQLPSPTPGAGAGQPTPPGNGGTMPPRGGPVQVPNALGAHPPADPFAVRDSPQGQAALRARQASGIVPRPTGGR